jgi:hypothetical protein
VKIAVLLLHLLLKATPLFRNIDISNLFLPLKVAFVFALTLRDAIGVSTDASLLSDALTMTAAAILTGLLLWPKPRAAALSARQE